MEPTVPIGYEASTPRYPPELQNQFHAALHGQPRTIFSERAGMKMGMKTNTENK
jgi:hypothetical protein